MIATNERIPKKSKFILQDLEAEIEAHQNANDMPSLLPPAGQVVVTAAESKASETELVRRKLDEMNRRWLQLEHKPSGNR